MVSSLRACLHAFERRGGQINWSAFETAVKISYKHAFPHASTSSMYDKESIARVLKSDAELFRLFKFRTSP